jgi:hypothetical protein
MTGRDPDLFARAWADLYGYPLPTTPHRGYDPGVDETTRLRPGLSRSARTAQRRPERLFIDSLGYDQSGVWHADKDGDL